MLTRRGGLYRPAAATIRQEVDRQRRLFTRRHFAAEIVDDEGTPGDAGRSSRLYDPIGLSDHSGPDGRRREVVYVLQGVEFARREAGSFDVIFLDPPFAGDFLPRVLPLLAAKWAAAAEQARQIVEAARAAAEAA